MLHVVSIDLGLLWVISIRPTLERKIKTMLLLFTLVKYLKLRLLYKVINLPLTVLSEDHVARVTKICCRQNTSRFIQIDNTASTRANLIILIDRIYHQSLGRDLISLITCMVE